VRNWRTMIEVAQYPYDWVLGVAEFVLLWEGMAANYDSQYRAYLPTLPDTLPPPAWWNQPNQQRRVVHTITNYTPGSSSNLPDMVQIADVLSKAYARGAGTVYLADTFGKIPAFWDQEVAAYRSGAAFADSPVSWKPPPAKRWICPTSSLGEP
jgi:hypothetical protein